MTLAAGELVVPDWAWGFALGVLFTGWVITSLQLHRAADELARVKHRLDRLAEPVRGPGDDPGGVQGGLAGPGGPAC